MNRFLILSGLLFTLTRSAIACDCEPVSPAEAIKRSDAILIGIVESETAISPSKKTIATPVKVVASFKGVSEKEVTIYQVNNECQTPLSKDGVYLIHAVKNGDKLQTDQCMHTASMKSNAVLEDLKALPPILSKQ